MRVEVRSPYDVMASAVQSASRPKNHAKPGRSLAPDVRYPAMSPVPSIGFVTIPLSMPIVAQSSAVFRSSFGVVTSSVCARKSR